jgi:hypothetical protein
MKVYIIIFINEWLAVHNINTITEKANTLIFEVLAKSKIKEAADILTELTNVCFLLNNSHSTFVNKQLNIIYISFRYN